MDATGEGMHTKLERGPLQVCRREVPEPFRQFLERRSIGYKIKRLSTFLSRTLNERLEPYELTRNHWIVLGCLWQSDGLPVTEICKRVQQVGGTLTGVLDRMEKRKIVRRKRDRRDRRVYRVWLTQSGEELMHVLPPVVQGIWGDVFDGITEQDKQRFSGILNRVLKNGCPDFQPAPFARSREVPGEYDGLFPPLSLGYRLKLLSLLMTRMFQDRAAEYNVTVSHWVILCRLWLDDGVYVTEVGEFVEQVGGTLTGVLDRMEERNLIERRPDARDGRCSRVWLTPAGDALFAVLPPIALEVVSKILKDIPQDDVDFFHAMFDRLLLNANG